MIRAFFEYLPCYFKTYRKWRGGVWRYVICKSAPLIGCWIHNEQPMWWEYAIKEENYG